MHNFKLSVCYKSSFFLFKIYKNDISHFASFLILFHALTINIRILRTTCVPCRIRTPRLHRLFQKLPVSPVESGPLGYIGYFKNYLSSL